jgi:hypothetical protein
MKRGPLLRAAAKTYNSNMNIIEHVAMIKEKTN